MESLRESVDVSDVKLKCARRKRPYQRVEAKLALDNSIKIWANDNATTFAIQSLRDYRERCEVCSVNAF